MWPCASNTLNPNLDSRLDFVRSCGAHLEVAAVVCRGVRESGEEGNDQGCSGFRAGAEGGLPPCHEQEAQGHADTHVGTVVMLAGLAWRHSRGRALQPPPQPCTQQPY